MKEYAQFWLLWMNFLTDTSIARTNPFSGHRTVITHTPDPKRPGFTRAKYEWQ